MQTSYASQATTEDLPYTLSFASQLGADTVASVAWSVTPANGLAVGVTSNTSTTATAWLSGGAAGTTYVVRALAVTAGGKQIQNDISILITQP